MNPLRSPKSTYVAAFILGGAIALLLAQPSRGAEPFRLDRIANVRFTPTPDDQLLLQDGVLDIFHDIAWRGTQSIPRWSVSTSLINVRDGAVLGEVYSVPEDVFD